MVVISILLVSQVADELDADGSEGQQCQHVTSHDHLSERDLSRAHVFEADGHVQFPWHVIVCKCKQSFLAASDSPHI